MIGIFIEPNKELKNILINGKKKLIKNLSEQS